MHGLVFKRNARGCRRRLGNNESAGLSARAAVAVFAAARGGHDGSDMRTGCDGAGGVEMFKCVGGAHFVYRIPEASVGREGRVVQKVGGGGAAP
jgi:hypothetical protein